MALFYNRIRGPLMPSKSRQIRDARFVNAADSRVYWFWIWRAESNSCLYGTSTLNAFAEVAND